MGARVPRGKGPHPPTRRVIYVLRKDVEEAVRNLKAQKSPEVDNILSELLKNEGEVPATVLTTIGQTI